MKQHENRQEIRAAMRRHNITYRQAEQLVADLDRMESIKDSFDPVPDEVVDTAKAVFE